jgi:tetratricopeptide (TPR) repeat protein
MKIITASLLTLGLALGSTTAFAAGESSSGGSAVTPPASGTMTSPMQLKCKKGEVVKTVKKKGQKDKKMCAKVTAGIIPDSELYEQGRLLAKQGQYEWALVALNAVQDQTDPHVLNYMGYSNRKAGRLDIAITYYNKALAIDPNFVLAREYLGEGYVAAGKIDLAKEQLAEIAARAGTNSEEYIDLNAAITGKSI